MISPNGKVKASWHPKKDSESKKLGSSSGWELAGAQLPSGRTRRQTVRLASQSPVGNADANDTATSPPPTDLVTCDSKDTPSTLTTSYCSGGRGKASEKSRIIVECKQVKNMLEKHVFCPLCKGPVIASLPTCCLATSIRIQCTNELCTFVDVERPSFTDFELPHDAGSPLIERVTDSAINILFVLSFICSGDGGTKAGRLCGLLGLPKSTSMKESSFGDIEKSISPHLMSICDKVIHDNLVSEVKKVLGDKKDNNNVLLFDLWKEKKLPHHLWPRLRTAGDMGWSGRSSSHTYNSLSGHACLVSEKNRTPIIWCVKSKHCCFCKT